MIPFSLYIKEYFWSYDQKYYKFYFCFSLTIYQTLFKPVHPKWSFLQMTQKSTRQFAPLKMGKKLQADLLKLVEWSHKWQLPFNQDKCKVIHYGRNNPCFDYYMSDENKPIPAAEEEKDLSVTFDQKRKFSNHVDHGWHLCFCKP